MKCLFIINFDEHIFYLSNNLFLINFNVRRVLSEQNQKLFNSAQSVQIKRFFDAFKMAR